MFVIFFIKLKLYFLNIDVIYSDSLLNKSSLYEFFIQTKTCAFSTGFGASSNGASFVHNLTTER